MMSTKNNTRQRVRFTLILTSFLLFPFTLYYFSPASPIMGLMDGVVNINLVIFSLQLLSAIFFGRIFCGWICPGSGITDICITINKNNINRKYNWIKYIFWIPWILSIIVLLSISENGVLFEMMHGRDEWISILEEGSLLVYYSIVGSMVILSTLIGKHSFCHHICWMAPFMIIGTKIGRLLKIPRLEVHFNKSLCNDCGICSTRCPMSIDIPKTQAAIIKDSDCTLCAECIDSCKKGALKLKI